MLLRRVGSKKVAATAPKWAGHRPKFALQPGLRVVGCGEDHPVGQFGTVECAGAHDRVLVLVSDAQLEQDVLEHSPRGGSGEGQQRRLAQRPIAGPSQRHSEVEVGGAEVVAPLGDAVSLVDHGQIDRRRLRGGGQFVAELLPLEPFGSDEDEMGVSRLPWEIPSPARDAHGTVDSVHAQTVDLVFHQCHQRVDYQGASWQAQPGELVDHAFARSGGQQHRAVVAGQYFSESLELALA